VQKGDGQAGAALTALANIQNDGAVLIANMNDIFDESLFEAFNKFLKSNTGTNALVGFYTEKYFPGGYLVLEDNYVKEVVEKPGEGKEPSEYVRLVFDYFNSAANLRQVLKATKSVKDDVYEVALSNMMKEGMKFEMIKHTGIWKTIKYPWHVLNVMEYFLSTIKGQKISKSANIAKSAKIIGNVIIEEGAKVFENAIVRGPAYVGRNTIVANNALVRDSMIGDDCVVGFATEIARSYISDSCWFHTNYVGDSILSRNVSMGSGAVTANLRLDEQDIYVNVKGEKVNTGLQKLGNIVGENVRIGINCSLSPGVKIGAHSMVGSNVLVTEDVENGKFMYVKQQNVVKDNKFDITRTSRDAIKKQLNTK